MPTQQASGIARLVDDYLLDCKDRGLARSTRDNSYGFPLKKLLLPFCEREGIGSVAEIDQAAINRLTRQLTDEGGPRGPLSVQSVHTYIRSMNHFLAWAKTPAGGSHDVSAKGTLPSLKKRIIPEILSLKQIDAIEQAADNERDALIVRLLADTGIRVGELVNLRTKDIDERKELKVRGKTGERFVALLPSLYRRLRAFIEHKRPKDSDSDRIFFSRRRRAGGDYEALTESGVQQLVRNLADRAEIKDASGRPMRVHPHTFRHSFITEMVKKNMNTLQLSRYVGHTTTRMIDTVYAHINSEDAHSGVLAVLRRRGTEDED